MKHRLKYFGVALIAVLTVCFVTHHLSRPEPMFHGKTVTEWIKEYGLLPSPKAIISTGSGKRYFAMMGKDAKGGTILEEVRIMPDGTTLLRGKVIGTNLVRTGQGGDARTNKAALKKPVLGDVPNSVRIFSTDMAISTNAEALVWREIGVSAAPYLVQALGRKDGFLARIQGELWLMSPPTVKSNYLSKPYPAVQLRRSAARILSQLDEAVEPAIPALIGAMSDPDAEVRRLVSLALLHHAARAQGGLMELVRGLNDTNQIVRSQCFMTLDNMGVKHAAIQSALDRWPRASESEDADWELIQSRDLHGPMAAIAVAGNLSKLTGEKRRERLRWLEGTADDASAAIPQLIVLLRDEDEETRTTVARILEKLGALPKAAPATNEPAKRNKGAVASRSQEAAEGK